MLLFLYISSHEYAELMANLIFSELHNAQTLSQLKKKKRAEQCVCGIFICSQLYLYIYQAR